MVRLRGNLTVRLASGYGILVVGTMATMVAVIYLGTVGVVERGIDSKIHKMSNMFLEEYRTGGVPALRREIDKLLNDNIDQDTEVYLLAGPSGKIAGNIEGVSNARVDRMTDQSVIRYGRPSLSRVLSFHLADGYTLIVGRDLADLSVMKQLVLRATLIGGVIALLLAIGGAMIFRRQLETRIAIIRRTAEAIEGGNLTQRIPEEFGLDEFNKLNHSINSMLDRIQRLMDGVKDVSNAIAHDLRTPLGRIRGLLDEAVSSRSSVELLADRAGAAIRGIDELILIFDKLLQIAEAEAGASRQSFVPVSLGEIILSVVELYDAAAEEKGIKLLAQAWHPAMTFGDKELLALATANLVDNALKCSGTGATIIVSANQEHDTASIVVSDNGPGIPESERSKVVARFYRLDRSRSQPGNGLGLAIVNAIGHLHGGALVLEDACPGLRARIVLPRLELATLRNGEGSFTRPLEATH